MGLALMVTLVASYKMVRGDVALILKPLAVPIINIVAQTDINAIYSIINAFKNLPAVALQHLKFEALKF